MERMRNSGSGTTESNRTFASSAEIVSSQLVEVELKHDPRPRRRPPAGLGAQHPARCRLWRQCGQQACSVVVWPVPHAAPGPPGGFCRAGPGSRCAASRTGGGPPRLRVGAAGRRRAGHRLGLRWHRSATASRLPWPSVYSVFREKLV
jgi:hypothetical protein